jgi:putative nucleotidyltransferase with HDIG domain
LALVRATSEDELLRQVTNTIVLHSDHQLATVCYAADDPQKSITPMAWSGTEDSYYLSDAISWANTEQGQLPIAKAIRNGKIENCADIASYAGYAPWKSAALAHSYASNIALPLNSGDKTFGGLSIYSSKINAFDTEEVQLLEELADDLAYGIEALRTRKEHEQHAIILRQSLKQFIQTIADTVEARDLYTAGHQRRVAELATAIAQEMGLPEEQIDGINLAAIIHDLGKIRIPSEILSKPGKINEVEFMLIKTHPQAGYDILKNVKFPWPIADIILQHHEKMDGSGYPQGLKGDQILLESRILTVADVVEAMSSHRPYRAALGIEAALDEIRRGRKVEYDAAAVDACLKLFTEKEFKFSDL